MSDESTILVVATDQLPEGLSAQLEKKNVFLEEAGVDHLGPALVAIAPDLVVFVGPESATEVLAALGDSDVPVAAIADRGSHADLRQAYRDRIAALIPIELPLSALAHRLMTLARRAANGEVLQRNLSLAPKAAQPASRGDGSPGAAARSVTHQAGSGVVGGKALGRSAATNRVATKKASASQTSKTSVGQGAVSKGAVSKTPGTRGPATRGPATRGPATSGPASKVAAEAVGQGPTPAIVSRAASPLRTSGAGLGARTTGAGASASQTGRTRTHIGLGPPPAGSVQRTASAAASLSSPRPRLGAPIEEQEERRSDVDEDGFEDSATAAFELPLAVRELARKRSLPPPPEPAEKAESSAPRLKAQPVPEREAGPGKHLAFDRTLLAESPLAPIPLGQETSAPTGRGSRGFEAPVPPAGSPPGTESRDSPDRLSSDGYSPPTSEQARRMQEAEALATRIRNTTLSASAIRVVVCDDDFLRADAISRELREHGLDVMLLSPDYHKARWSVLRRYAPHGLLVDERSLSKGGRQIVGTFRRDPFLKYVPLVAIRFDRLFREEEARANLAPLFPLLQPLGREELTLLDRLTLSGTLTVDLSQVLPNRLVDLLGAYHQTCALECNSGGRRLTWPISAGQAGKAELAEPGSAGTSLRAEDALRWLLAQDEPQITVATRPQIRLTNPEPIEDLLDRLTSAIDAPPEHSVAPPDGGRHLMAGVYAQTLMGVGSAQGHLSGPAGMPTVPAPNPTAEGGSPAIRMVADAPLPRDAAAIGAFGSSRGQGAGHLAVPAGAAGAHALDRARSALVGAGRVLSEVARVGVARAEPTWVRLTDLVLEKKKAWPPYLFWGGAFSLGFVPVLVLALLFAGGSDGRPSASSESPAASAPEESASKTVPTSRENQPSAPQAASPGGREPPADPDVVARAQQADFGRFRVAPDKSLPSCRQLLGAEVSGSPRQAQGYWKAARQKLVQGDSEAAHELMCRSALIDVHGGAAEGLVGYYLGRRSLAEAENWVTRVLAAAPDRRTAKELFSDIRNQQGETDEALAVLLETLRLTPGDERKRGLVARKFMGDARTAERSGDFPRAERLLRRAVILDPKNWEAAQELAEVFLRLGLPDAARLWAEHILREEKGYSGAHMVLGDIARLDKDYETARRHYKLVQPGTPGAGRAEGYLQDMPM